MNILVTGSEGFVGSETCRVLEEKGHQIFRYDIMKGFDICDVEQLDVSMREFAPDRVLHLAAIARFSEADDDPVRCHAINVDGTINIAKICAKHGIPLVFASTGSVYMPINSEPPITETFRVSGNSQYACSKLLGELQIQHNMVSVPWMVLRYAHLYGKEKRGHGLIGGYWDRIRRGLQPKLYGGAQSNDFCCIKDVARANLLALEASWDKWNQIYNIGTGEELSAKAAGEMICEITGWKGGIEVHDGRVVDAQRFVYDISKAEVMLKFKSEYSFKDGLREMFADEILEKGSE